MSTPTIGIDFGTTCFCVGVWINDRVEIIPNEEGNKCTPSYVAFDNTQRLIGEAAKNQAVKNPTNTIFDVTRLIGRNFSDQSIQNKLKLWPFKVEPGKDDKPLIVIEYKGKIIKFPPEIICSMILQKMKEMAEEYLGQTVINAVLTVPANFNYHQKQLINDAGTIAGLKVLRIMNESTSASIAYGFTHNPYYEEHILVFDLGGGTLNVSLVAIEDEVVEVKATAGNNNLGGDDFDNILLNYCCEEFMHQKGIDITKNQKSLRRLRIQCEQAKRMLSIMNEITIEIDSLINNEDFCITIKRAKFEDLCMNLFEECIKPVENVLKDSEIQKDHINEIVLIGGSSRIPKVQQLLKNYFNGKELNKSLNQDEAVAYGATIQAAILAGYSPFLLLDVTSLSLGIEGVGGVMQFIIPRNSTIPLKRSEEFNTENNPKIQMPIKIYEGENLMTKDCLKLGEINLDEFTSLSKDLPKIYITIEIDEQGILHIQAVNMQNNKGNSITIIKDNFSMKENQEWIRVIEKFKAEDDFIKQKITANNNLEEMIYTIMNTIKDEKLKDKFSFEDITQLQALIQETIEWINENPNADPINYFQKIKVVKELFQTIMLKVRVASQSISPEASLGFPGDFLQIPDMPEEFHFKMD